MRFDTPHLAIHRVRNFNRQLGSDGGKCFHEIISIRRPWNGGDAYAQPLLNRIRLQMRSMGNVDGRGRREWGRRRRRRRRRAGRVLQVCFDALLQMGKAVQMKA